MQDRKWYWKGGRLEAEDGTCSYDIDTAYHLIPAHEDIREACRNVLMQYNINYDNLRGLDR